MRFVKLEQNFPTECHNTNKLKLGNNLPRSMAGDIGVIQSQWSGKVASRSSGT